jgi:hypothetical protein
MKQVAAGLATLGRGEDKVLVHMTPGEVHGLQAIALAHGGSLTINPHTGLPEAGFLRNILPAIAAAAAVAFLGPAAGAAAGATGALGMGAAGTGAAAGALTGALTNKENRLQGALMGGLGGYGIGGGMGAGMQSGLFGGTEAAGAGTLNTAAGITPPPTGSLSGIGLQSPTAVGTPPIGDFSLAGGSQGVAGATSVGLQGPASSAALGAGTGTGTDIGLQASSGVADTLGQKATPSFMQALGEQFPTGMSKGAAGLGALGMVGAFDTPEPPEMPQEPRSTARLSGPVRRPYDPERNLFTDYGTLQPTYAAKGGEMRSVPQLEDGGFVLTKKAVDGMGGQREAAAGLGAIPIRGPGTGTSDSIPTTIDGVRPAKVSNGEAYVPRKRVKQAGGAKRLYALMRRAEQDAKRRSA